MMHFYANMVIFRLKILPVSNSIRLKENLAAFGLDPAGVSGVSRSYRSGSRSVSGSWAVVGIRPEAIFDRDE